MMETSPRVARKVRAKRERSGGPKGTIRLRSPVLTNLAITIAFLILAAWIVASDLLFLRGSESLIGLLIGAVVILIAIVFFMLPLLLGNVLTGMTLVIRYGIQFSEEIPLYEIEKVELMERLPASSGFIGAGVKLGVTYSMLDKRFTVLRSRRGIVRIKLVNDIPVRNLLIPRMVNEIVFDTLDGDKIVKRVNEVKSEAE